jgi:hypothetical protein
LRDNMGHLLLPNAQFSLGALTTVQLLYPKLF